MCPGSHSYKVIGSNLNPGNVIDLNIQYKFILYILHYKKCNGKYFHYSIFFLNKVLFKFCVCCSLRIYFHYCCLIRLDSQNNFSNRYTSEIQHWDSWTNDGRGQYSLHFTNFKLKSFFFLGDNIWGL